MALNIIEITALLKLERLSIKGICQTIAPRYCMCTCEVMGTLTYLQVTTLMHSLCTSLWITDMIGTQLIFVNMEQTTVLPLWRTIIQIQATPCKGNFIVCQCHAAIDPSLSCYMLHIWCILSHQVTKKTSLTFS